MTHMQSDHFWTSIDLLGLPIGPIQAFSSIYAVGQFLKTKIILGRTDGPSQRTHSVYIKNTLHETFPEPPYALK